jgi:hypothetical protein
MLGHFWLQRFHEASLNPGRWYLEAVFEETSLETQGRPRELQGQPLIALNHGHYGVKIVSSLRDCGALDA